MKLKDLYIPAEQHVQQEKIRKHKPLCCFYCLCFWTTTHWWRHHLIKKECYFLCLILTKIILKKDPLWRIKVWAVACGHLSNCLELLKCCFVLFPLRKSPGCLGQYNSKFCNFALSMVAKIYFYNRGTTVHKRIACFLEHLGKKCHQKEQASWVMK